MDTRRNQRYCWRTIYYHKVEGRWKGGAAGTNLVEHSNCREFVRGCLCRPRSRRPVPSPHRRQNLHHVWSFSPLSMASKGAGKVCPVLQLQSSYHARAPTQIYIYKSDPSEIGSELTLEMWRCSDRCADHIPRKSMMRRPSEERPVGRWKKVWP